jgi:hypothetical protein
MASSHRPRRVHTCHRRPLRPPPPPRTPAASLTWAALPWTCTAACTPSQARWPSPPSTATSASSTVGGASCMRGVRAIPLAVVVAWGLGASRLQGAHLGAATPRLLCSALGWAEHRGIGLSGVCACMFYVCTSMRARVGTERGPPRWLLSGWPNKKEGWQGGGDVPTLLFLLDPHGQAPCVPRPPSLPTAI